MKYRSSLEQLPMWSSHYCSFCSADFLDLLWQTWSLLRVEAHSRAEVHPISFHFIPCSWQESLTKKQATHGIGLPHYVSKKQTKNHPSNPNSYKAASKISAVCVVCGNEKLLHCRKNLMKLCSSINNPFKIFI